MNILVLNAGSSSLKFQLIKMPQEKQICKGNCERIGIDGRFSYTTESGISVKSDVSFASHSDAVEKILDTLTDPENGVCKSLDEIDAIGNRVVHGGDYYSSSTLITDEDLKTLKSLIDLAPLHNKGALQTINATKKLLKDTPQVAVFDTSFHQTVPLYARVYPLPHDALTDLKIKKYGFHGTSHRYVSERAAKIIGKPADTLKIITCHLGNGSSITAVKGGRSVETSMGFTPVDGLIMGTRCGCIDPSALLYYMKKKDLTVEQAEDTINKNSGLLGIASHSDYRDLKSDADRGDKDAKLALDILSYDIRKYIAVSAAALDGVDAVVFTGGIGENADDLREDVCNNLKFLGVVLDKSKNSETVHGKEAKISAADSKTEVYVIPTNEEIMIAKDTESVLNETKI